LDARELFLAPSRRRSALAPPSTVLNWHDVCDDRSQNVAVDFRLQPNTMTSANLIDPAATLRQFSEVCRRAALTLEQLDPQVTRRMLLLAEYTATFDDCTRTMDMAEEVFAHCARAGVAFTANDQNIVRIGSLFSDIGKTGPAHASLEQQRLIARMFAVEGVRNDQMTVAAFFASYFTTERDQALATFVALGLDPHLTMRRFWNLHGEWTLEVLRNSGVPHEGVAAAAAHHLLEHVNPRSMVADDGSFTHFFGANAAFDRPEKLVIVLDKYDAARRRGRRTHAEAISWLRKLLATNLRFGSDLEFLSLIDVMDVVFAEDERWG
jgi:hypothetical protein